MRKSIVPILLGIAAATLVWLSTSLYGVGMTTVSGDYVSAARSLVAGEGFVQHDGRAYIEYPPLYPVALAAFGWAGMDPQDGARWFNALCLGLLVFFGSRWLQRFLASGLFATLGGLALLVSVPLLDMSISAFPETLFMLLVLLALWSATRYAGRGRGLDLTAAVVFCALACLTRYMGVTVIFAAAVIVLFRRSERARERVGSALLLAALSILPTLIWLVRNAAITGSAAGNRGASDFTLLQNLGYMLHVLSVWILPERIPNVARVGVVVVLALAVVVWLVDRRRGDEPRRAEVYAMAFFAAVYVGATVVALSLVALDRMNTRYLIPAYVPLALVLFAAADSLAARVRGRAVLASVSLVLFLWVLLNGRYDARKVSESRARGAAGYSTAAWHNDAMIEALRAHPLSGLVYSNDAYAVDILTGIPARPSPRKYRFNSRTSTTNDIERFAATVDSAGSVSLVWLDRVQRDYLYSQEDLASRFHLEVADSTTDGRVYRVTR
jgi:hypothetical protein